MLQFVTHIRPRDQVFIVPIQRDLKKHPMLNSVSFYYCFDIESKEEFIVNCTHSDSEIRLNSVLPTDISKTAFVYNKRLTTDYRVNKEVKTMYWFAGKSIPETNDQIDWYDTKFKSIPNLRDYIPITILVQKCRELKDSFLQIKDISQSDSYIAYDELVNNFIELERNGICTESGMEYTEYNPWTLTGRPSNIFNSINYAAINKVDGSRRRFISRFGSRGILLEFDLASYHPYLISKLVGYDYPEISFYEHLMKYLPSNVDAKLLTFQWLYGNQDSSPDFEYFKLVKKLTANLSIKNKIGMLQSAIFQKPLHYAVNGSKLLNYYVQNFETEVNSGIIGAINTALSKFQSRLVLYNYDSFLIDVNIDEIKQTGIIKELKTIFDSIPYRCKLGRNYHDMIPKKI